jgi:hypothetical protein
MNGDSCLNVERVDTVRRIYQRLVLRKGPLWLILFVAALAPAFASNVEIGTMTVARSCNPDGVQLCTGTVTVLNEMEDFLMVNISFTVGSSSFSTVPAQVIFPNEAISVEDQDGADEYKNVKGLTLLSVSGELGGISVPPLTFTTPVGTFTASSDSWASPQFQANFAGTLGIFVEASQVSTTPTNVPEPSGRGLMVAVIGLLCIMRRHISRSPARAVAEENLWMAAD